VSLLLVHSFIHSDIFIASIQFHYYSESLPTQHGYCAGVSRNCELWTCPRSLNVRRCTWRLEPHNNKALVQDIQPRTLPLFALWQCPSQAWMKEEGDANDLWYELVSLNSANDIQPLWKSMSTSDRPYVPRFHSYIGGVLAPIVWGTETFFPDQIFEWRFFRKNIFILTPKICYDHFCFFATLYCLKSHIYHIHVWPFS